MVIAKQDITIFRIVEVEDITRYYTLNEDWPDKPTANPPSSEWSETEPDTSFEGSASGTSLKLTDVSPIEHTMDVKVRSKNLLSPSSIIEGYEISNTRLAVNADWYVMFANVLPNTTYTFSGFSARTTLEEKENGELVRKYNNSTFTTSPTTVKVYFNSLNTTKGENQLELGSTATEYTPYIADLSTVEIKRYGKNLLNNSLITSPGIGLTLSAGVDGSYNISGTLTNRFSYFSRFLLNIPAGTTVTTTSWYSGPVGAFFGVVLRGRNDNIIKQYNATPSGIANTITLDEDCVAASLVVRFTENEAGDSITIKNINIQLEIGSTATAYEPYVESVSHTPLEDGTVKGVTSLYPTTTLMSNTSGVIIDAEYSKDTSKSLYFTDLTTYTDDTYKYSEVSKSSDYEAAKEAFNKALISKNTAEDAKDATDDLNTNLTKTITEQYSTLTTNIDSISGSVTKLETTVEETNTSTQKTIAELQEQVNMSITSDEVNIAIEKKLQNGVTKVDTKTGFTFDENGLNVNKTGSETNTQITEDGMYVRNTETDKVVLTANKDGVEARDLKATTYLIVGGRSRFENYKTDRTGCFWIGG